MTIFSFISISILSKSISSSKSRCFCVFKKPSEHLGRKKYLKTLLYLVAIISV